MNVFIAYSLTNRKFYTVSLCGTLYCSVRRSSTSLRLIERLESEESNRRIYNLYLKVEGLNKMDYFGRERGKKFMRIIFIFVGRKRWHFQIFISITLQAIQMRCAASRSYRKMGVKSMRNPTITNLPMLV